MTTDSISLATFYKGWDVYQQHLTKAIAPLTAEQLILRAAPHLRSIGMLATHIIATRANWFHGLMQLGGSELEPLTHWTRPESPTRSADELVQGFEITWQMIQDALTQWTPVNRAIFDTTSKALYNPCIENMSRHHVVGFILPNMM
jgi:uncharacterized damage-inducible protein DinB